MTISIKDAMQNNDVLVAIVDSRVLLERLLWTPLANKFYCPMCGNPPGSGHDIALLCGRTEEEIRIVYEALNGS